MASGYRSLNLLLFLTWVSFTTLNLVWVGLLGYVLGFFWLCGVFFF